MEGWRSGRGQSFTIVEGRFGCNTHICCDFIARAPKVDARKVCPGFKIIRTVTDKGCAASSAVHSARWRLHSGATARERMPDMYAISSDNGRRASQTGPERPELPILFHLMDVSRPRAAAKDVLAAPAAAEPPKAVEAQPSVPATAPLNVAAAMLSAPAAEVKATPAPGLSAVSSEAVSAEVVDSPIEMIAAAAKPASENVPAAKSVAESAVAAVLESTADANQPAATVSLKPKAVKPQAAERRQRRTPPSEDWFASHGKFIAVAFVIALIGTVYYARTNRQQTTPAKTEAVAQSPLVEMQPPESAAEIATKSVQTVAAVSDSKVELQPPSAPALIASSSSSDKPAGGDKLFDFPATAKAEQRIAARPTSAPAESKNEQSPTTPATATAAPALATAYPVTTSPASYPSTTAAPGAYPQTAAAAQRPSNPGPSNSAPNYRSQFPAQSPQQPIPQQPIPQQPIPQQPMPQPPPPQPLM